jgi:hypothetical protein
MGFFSYEDPDCTEIEYIPFRRPMEGRAGCLFPPQQNFRRCGFDAEIYFVR